MFSVLCVYLIYIVTAYGTRWFTTPYNSRIASQKTTVRAGDIKDRNGLTLASEDEEGNRVYIEDRSSRRASSHVIGDNYGQVFGAETFYAEYLLGFDQNLYERVYQAVNGKRRKGSDVRLTVDGKLNDYVYDMMDYYRGAVIVMNYKTGEILASVSQPTFDPKYMEDYLSGEKELADSAMVNRVTMGKYTPGSVFKLITLTAALRYIPNVEERIFHCGGPLVFDRKTGSYIEDVQISPEEEKLFVSEPGESDAGETPDPGTENVADRSAEPPINEKYSLVRDYHGDYHGDITLKEALEVSCNTTFGRLAMEVGTDRLAKVAREFGIGEDYLFDDMMVYSSSYTKADTNLNLAWSGVGQYKDIMTPLQMCMISSCIANEGVMMEPKLLRMVITSQNTISKSVEPKVLSRPFRTNEAELLRDYMMSVVENGTGKRAKIGNYKVGGKTGTAEVSGNKGVEAHAWFTGFVYNDDHPLAICVILEKAGSGGSVAAPIAGKILKKAIELGY
jgi:peptidoglycan glycosyltransferase